jgi:hypothetical protein
MNVVRSLSLAAFGGFIKTRELDERLYRESERHSARQQVIAKPLLKSTGRRRPNCVNALTSSTPVDGSS